MKDRKTEDGGRSAARKWVTIRVTEKEKTHLLERADVSEYMRRRFFGGTIVSYADVKTVGELRRIGGLLKHNFETLRQAKAPSGIMKQQEDALRKRVWLIQKIGLALIVKKIKNRKSEKPKSWQIGDLVDCIRFPHNKNPQEKIAYAGGRNFCSTTHAGQKIERQATFCSLVAGAGAEAAGRTLALPRGAGTEETQPAAVETEQGADAMIALRMRANGHSRGPWKKRSAPARRLSATHRPGATGSVTPSARRIMLSAWPETGI